MTNKSLEDYIRECEGDYKKFMGISEFPEYAIIEKEFVSEVLEKKEYMAIATAIYDCTTKSYRLEVYSQIYDKAGRNNIFHELTHIWDHERYIGEDINKKLTYHAYSEYHASQVQLMEMLGAKTVHQVIPFSVNDIVQTIMGEMSVKQYLEQLKMNISVLVSKEDFSNNLETLSMALGGIFNYYGSRSICKMHAVDYCETENFHIIKQLISQETVNFLDDYMTGWFDEIKISYMGIVFANIVYPLLKEYQFL